MLFPLCEAYTFTIFLSFAPTILKTSIQIQNLLSFDLAMVVQSLMTV